MKLIYEKPDIDFLDFTPLDCIANGVDGDVDTGMSFVGGVEEW